MTALPGPLETDVHGLVRDSRLGITLHLKAGERGLGRPIRHPRVQKSGLALAGHYHGVVPTRVQLLGETELSYLESLPSEARSLRTRGFLSLGLSCLVVTGNRALPQTLTGACEATETPLFVSEEKTSRTINAIHDVLDDRLAPRAEIHGVLVDVFGVGLLLLGKSGIGKSECAVELVLRGHRLVADDIVTCDFRPPGMVFGAPKDLLRHHIELRGLGVLNLHEMFGVTAVRERKRIDVVVRLEEWDDQARYDRLGLDQQYYAILGTQIRLLTIPVRPARDMGSILEIAARNELLRRAGRNPAEDFVRRLENRALGAEHEVPSGPPSLEPTATGFVPPPPSSAVNSERSPALEIGARRRAHSTGAPAPGTLSGVLRSEQPAISTTESSAWIPAIPPSSKGKDP